MLISNIDQAKVLTQALPYIQKYYGKTVVVKYGGNAMLNEGLKDAVISDLVLLSLVGINVVMIHGGGPEINDLLTKLDIQSEFINGLRYTSEDAVEVVQMVLSGKINKSLVNKIQKIGGRAIGLSGVDGGMIKAKKFEDGVNDYGCVGEITDVDVSIIKDVIDDGYIPVVSTVACSVDDNSAIYNINADTAAAKIAIALGAEKLILLTDVRGLMADVKDDDTLIPVVKLSDVDRLKSENIIKGGMIPKVDCCVNTILGGVKRAHIIDGRMTHSILIEMLSDEGIGTMFLND